MNRIPLETWYYEIPIITRIFVSCAIGCSILVQCDLVTPYQLFFSWRAALDRAQYWRFLTTFLFFGDLSIDFFFHLFFMSRYCRMLEETYAQRTVDFAWLLFVLAGALLAAAPIASDPFLGTALSFSLTYLWSRRNPGVEMSFLGLFNFSAAYLPWVLVAFSCLVNGRMPVQDVLGLVVGHIVYFLEDIWPRNPASGGKRLLKCPEVIRRLFLREETLVEL
ncbi:hypothetical protein PYCC9005_004213 [Savitreella phatthalungensis]